MILSYLPILIIILLCIILLLILIAIFRFQLLVIFGKNPMKHSSLYIGRVKHHRLKGGAMHALNYPLCFSFLDLKEIEKLGSIMWPIFGTNYGWLSLCSFDFCDHLKGWNINNNDNSKSSLLYNKVLSFANSKTNGKLNCNDNTKPIIQIMTHLTYFGYCFNPVSFYYLYGFEESKSLKTTTTTTLLSSSSSGLQAMIAEVANTPWIEQHSYMLHESVEGVDIIRKTEISSNAKNNNDTHDIFEASWDKEFHVSPFMEMDYRYTFTFSEPKDNVWVRSKMAKKNSNNDIWFTASFEMKRIPFTALNILYILFCYPLYTRIIQIWIHIEAIKIAIKGVPLYGHPNGTDVDFGLGITGDRIRLFFNIISYPIVKIIDIFNKKKSKNE